MSVKLGCPRGNAQEYTKYLKRVHKEAIGLRPPHGEKIMR